MSKLGQIGNNKMEFGSSHIEEELRLKKAQDSKLYKNDTGKYMWVEERPGVRRFACPISGGQVDNKEEPCVQQGRAMCTTNSSWFQEDGEEAGL